MPPPAPPWRARVRRQLRRRRRPLAALLAGAGMLLALASLRPAAPEPELSADAPPPWSQLAPGEVAVPILLASPALSTAVSVGDLVDVLAADGEGSVRTLAERARVLDIPDGATGFGGSGRSVIVIATGRADGLAVSAATAVGPVSFLIREQGASG